MKKKIIVFVFLILGILSVSSCKQNKEEPKPSNEESNKQEIDGTYSLESLSIDLSFVEYYKSITIEDAICENVKLEKKVLEWYDVSKVDSE